MTAGEEPVDLAEVDRAVEEYLTNRGRTTVGQVAEALQLDVGVAAGAVYRVSKRHGWGITGPDA